MKPNPAPSWVSKTVAKNYGSMGEAVTPAWFPKLEHMQYAWRGKVTAALPEYGCGAYGCVFPTIDPSVVMKVTTDDTEAQFARDLAATLVAPVCVRYHAFLETSAQHAGRRVYFLWRDSADHVGELDEVVGEAAGQFIDTQHEAAQAAYLALYRKRPAEALLARWRATCLAMAESGIAEIDPLGRGLMRVFDEQGIFFGDIHGGNLGMVAGRWVITDPGHVAVLARSSLASNPPRHHIPAGPADYFAVYLSRNPRSGLPGETAMILAPYRDEPTSLPQATADLRALKARGLTAWVVDRSYTHVAVPGALRAYPGSFTLARRNPSTEDRDGGSARAREISERRIAALIANDEDVRNSPAWRDAMSESRMIDFMARSGSDVSLGRRVGTGRHEHTRVDIHWYAFPNENKVAGGFLPMIEEDGKRRGDEWRDRGYSKAEAETEAEEWAHRAASRFVGDWNVVVTKGRPPRR